VIRKASSDSLGTKRCAEGHDLVLWAPTEPVAVLCAKCGSVGEPAVVWVAPGNVMFLAGVQFTGECLVRTCRRCGYSHATPTLDQTTPHDLRARNNCPAYSGAPGLQVAGD
jgi:hypothetical protein